MKNGNLDDKIRTAFEHATPDVLDHILSSCEEQKGNVIPMTAGKHNKKRTVSIVSAAAAVCILFSAAMIWQPWNVGTVQPENVQPGVTQTGEVDSIITLDVNPSISIDIDQNETVVAVQALNDDAEKVIGDMDLQGTDLDVTVNALIGSMLKNGYLDEAKNSILVTVENDDQARGDELKEQITNDIKKVFSEDGLEAAVLSQTLTEDEQIDALAEQYGISKGKAALIQELIGNDKTLTFESLAPLSVQEIALLYASRQSDDSSVTQSGAVNESSYIGVEAAKKAAFTHAGVSESDVTKLEVEYDNDDGVMVYEVDFHVGTTEYDYEIDAKTGDVLKVEKDVDDDAPNAGSGNTSSSGSSSGNSSSSGSSSNTNSYISGDTALQKALAHAGVSASQAVDVDVEFDDGHYDVDFRVGSTEYDYEIDAKTGAVLRYEKDVDDDHQSSSSSASSSSSSSSASSYISKDEAKQKAFSHAGVSASQASGVKVDWDDGHYDVEFRVGTTEYDYEINAKTGAVIRYEKDTEDEDDDDHHSTSTSTSSYIGRDAAKQKALNHAGLSESDVYELEVELDEEDGIYEVSFETKSYEYDYEVQATTGKILKAEKD